MARARTGLSRVLRAAASLPGRIIITAILLGLVARAIDWGELGDALAEARWEYAALGLGLAAASITVAGVRWALYLDALGLEVSRAKALRAYFVGTFSNIALPTGFGGDAVRAWLVGRTGVRLAQAATSVVYDRLTALGCLVLLAWVGVAVDGSEMPSDQIGLLGLTTLAGVAGAGIGLYAARGRLVRRLLPEALRPWAREVVAAVVKMVTSVRLQLATIALGLVAQAAIVGVVWALAEAISVDLSPWYLAVVTTLVLIATLLPVSIAGFGIREGTYVALLGAVGVSATDAALISVLSVPTMALASLPGGIALLLGRASVPSQAGTRLPPR